MNAKTIGFSIVLILAVVTFLAIFVLPQYKEGLSSSDLTVQKKFASPIPSPIPSPKPRTFQYDSKTDLGAELETVNPKVLDSDFK